MKSIRDISVIILAENSKNPYFRLLSNALEKRGVRIIQRDRPLFLPLTRAALGHSGNILQLDWLYVYYMSDGYTGYKLIDDLITLSRAILFLFDLLLVSQLQTAIVWTVHNKRHHEGKYPQIERIVNEFGYWVTDAVIVKCGRARDELVSTYRNAKPEIMEVASDGNYISTYQNKVSEQEARSDLGIGSDTFVYLYFGIIREYKGIPELITTFRDLDLDGVELWIVGQPKTTRLGRQISDLSELSSDIHTVLEYINEERVQYYMNAADVLVLPYRDILNSGSVHLGLSFGIPIIAPKIGCIPDTVPAENDFLYDQDGPNSLAYEMSKTYERTDLDAVGEANYEHAVTQSWDKTAKRFESVYISALD